jgi:hypothetical protein
MKAKLLTIRSRKSGIVERIPAHEARARVENNKWHLTRKRAYGNYSRQH